MKTKPFINYTGLSEYQKEALRATQKDDKLLNFVNNIANIVSHINYADPREAILEGDLAIADITQIITENINVDFTKSSPYNTALLVFNFMKELAENATDPAMKELAKKIMEELGQNASGEEEGEEESEGQQGSCSKSGKNQKGQQQNQQGQGKEKSREEKEAQEKAREEFNKAAKEQAEENKQKEEGEGEESSEKEGAEGEGEGEGENKEEDAIIQSVKEGAKSKKGKKPFSIFGKKGLEQEEDILEGGNVTIGDYDFSKVEKMGRNLGEVVNEMMDYRRVYEETCSLKNALGNSGVTGSLPPEDIKEKLELLEEVAILETEGKLKSRKQSIKKERKKMKKYSQLGKLTRVSKLADPTFGLKLAQKKLQVNKKKYLDKQLLCLMIDDSGSMYNSFKMKWVKAIMIHRCMEARKGNADLYVAAFEGTYSHFKKINNVEEGLDYCENVMSYNGGGTDIQNSINELSKELKSKMESNDTEIMIINDGQDYVDPETWNFTSKFHAIMLGARNENLSTVVENSGGLYKVIEGKDSYY